MIYKFYITTYPCNLIQFNLFYISALYKAPLFYFMHSLINLAQLLLMPLLFFLISTAQITSIIDFC